ncbi:MAG: hypothetical protein J5528_00500, partial [Firmicutes bacterium]|nr:hypothetical protein [Bacillota bacterium]
MNVSSILKKLMSVLLAAILMVTMIPSAVYADIGQKNQSEHLSQIPEAVLPASRDDGEISKEDDWIATYPYGTFAFGDFQSDVAEEGAVNDEGKVIPSSIRIPVYRVGGTSGRVTAKITYAPAVTMMPDGSDYLYDYAASGKKDLVIRNEDPKTIAQYQEIGMPDGLRNMLPSDEAIVFEDPGDDVDPEDELVLILSGNVKADSYQWQTRSTLGWTDVKEAEDPGFPTLWKNVWDFDKGSLKDIDYRCIYVIDGQYYCSESLFGEKYEKIPPIPKAPEDLPLDEKATYSVLEFEDDFDVYEFDLTFADGETVKYIEIDAIDDNEPELPEMGIFTIVECEGGELSDLCNTHTVLVSDNDEHGISEIGFEVKDYRVDRNSGTAYVKVIRKGDKSYNVTVDYTTEDGTAKEGVDYAKASGTIALLGSIDEIEIPIDLIKNNDTESKTFKVKLSNVKGGGLDGLCSIASAETTVTLVGVMSSEERAGLNLASVLAGSDGENLTSSVEVSENALIKDRTVTEWNYEGKNTIKELEGVITIHPATRSHLAYAGLTFSRKDYEDWVPKIDDQGNPVIENGQPVYVLSGSSYEDSGDYWVDRELMTGVDHRGLPSGYSEGLNVMNYPSEMAPIVMEEDYVNGEIPSGVKTSAGYKTGTLEHAYMVYTGNFDVSDTGYEDRSLQYYRIASNYEATASLTIEHAGLLFKDFHFSFDIENYGKKGSSSYIYPMVWFEMNGEESRRTSRNITYGALGESSMINVRSDKDFTRFWILNLERKNADDSPVSFNNTQASSTSDEQVVFETLSAYTQGRSRLWYLDFEDNPLSTGIDFISVDQYDQDYTPRTSPEVADSQTIVDIINFNFGRRAFADNMTIPVVIYTANDDNELQNGWSPIDVSTKEGKDIYDRLAPEISIVAKNGGVTKGGGLYVGSTLKVNCSRVAGFIVNPNLGVYLTNADGKIVAQGKAANGEGTIYEITFLWSDMTEADLSGKYQLNVVYDRSQTILIDIAPSVPRLSGSTSIDTNSVPSVWGGLFSGNKTIKVEYGKAEVAKTAQTVTVVSGNNASTFTDYANFESLTLDLGSGDFKGDTGKGIYASNTEIKNVQSICFNQSEDDVIVFNGQAYKGNEYIPLDSNDIVAQNLIFRYYAADYLDAISTMVATFDHAELYYDGDGDGEISGSFVGSVFVPSGDDVFVGNIKGEHFEQEFAPKLKGDDGVYQYYIKAIYSLRPRALKLPAGASADSYAQVYPVFLSAVTDDKESDKLTREQKAYRYIRGNNTDGHTMYGAEASKLAYIDIPLGGDTSKVKRYSVTTGVYDTSGEKLIDSINTTEYTWEPEYTGALVVGFDNPEPVINDDNITGRAIPYAGEAPELTEDGQYLYSDDGLDKLNAYLGAFAGRTTFGLCVQEQVKAFSEINSIADLTPESIEKGNVSSVPNGNNVVNFGSGENKDETEGETPDGTGFNEFGSDNGMKLPSLEFGIGDYATLVMDGDEIGISIGIPLFKAESTSYGTDNTTTGADGSTTETYKDDDGNTVKKTTKPDGSTETETTTVDDDKPNNRKTVTRRVETVDKDGNKTYFNETKTYETAPGKDDRHMATITDTDAPSTPSNNDADEKTNGFKEANGQMKTLKDFACAVVSRAKGNPGAVSSFMDGAFEDDTLKKAKNGQSSCRKVSVSLSVQIALNFEYNPIYNTHKFSSGAISASVSFEFSLQYRFTPVPLVYVYVKTGVSVEIGIGMGMVYSLVEKDPITKFESGNMESLEKKNGKMIFKLDKEYSGFHSYFYGKMYMEVFDHMPKAGDKALTSGVISSRGDVSEVLLSQYKGDLYICLTSIGDKVTMTKLMPITKASKAYFNGASITPSVSVEAGVGVGIELLKFELYVKTNLAITATFGQYIPDEDKYEPAYMSNFDWNISVGFNVVLLFINYSMDCVAFSVNGEQDGTGGYFTWVITASAANGMKELWTETRYTDAHGKPISDPTGGRRSESSERTVRSVEGGRGLIRISSPTDITQTQKINEVKTSVDELQRIMRGEVEETRSFPATGTKDFELSGYGTSGDARILATGLTTGYSYK